MRIGPHLLANRLFVAPMAGVTDRPFRRLCKQWGAGYAVSEMVTSRPDLWNSLKTSRRADHTGEPGPIAVQIAGTEPGMMADAARYNVDHGAQIIDINMGCPAKKVCNVLAGSALMRDPQLVGRILDAVVQAVNVPVTLKIRTGWDLQQRNGVTIATIAEQAGIQALAVHGRTRACGYRGPVDYASIAAIKQAVRIPVIANGDIDSPTKARQVLELTGADAVMIGRAAQGRPWIFAEIARMLAGGEPLPPPSPATISAWVLEHLRDLHTFYGEPAGVRIARKHLAWYSQHWPAGSAFRARMNTLDSGRAQRALVRDFFERLADEEPLAA
ncbi:MAG TPA: tRNA dihydrouridine synthase DusB [Giesbergeria sp.]|nr:tRNA dihydrouridine synthase DusB [Giesbergeria sp.]